MGAPIVGVTPIFALSFGGNNLGKKLQMTTPDQQLNVGQLALAGGFSGILTTVIMAPGERIKCILQVSNFYRVKQLVLYKINMSPFVVLLTS